MRLKHLTLQGYKTFASRTEFEFEGGITAIVGPNGSGKSNVADAIRWVLGEQSYSALRGKRTTDMIFAGSQGRPRVGMAQAILRLDNSDGWLPIDYAELEIGRRAYRSGENEYLLNGQKVRLKDITDLLATSGLAERTYTIIGQGLIDQALSLRAEERRALFEEAAGVSLYKSKRAETLRRLDETARNLIRVQDILSEIRPRMSSLRRQAERAQNYGQVAADLRYHLRIWYGFQWENARRRLREARAESVDARRAWQQARDRVAEIQEELAARRRAAAQLQARIQEQQQEAGRRREEAARLSREIAVMDERSAQVERQLDETAQEAGQLEELLAQANAELALALEELQAAREELGRAEAEGRQFDAEAQGVQEAIAGRQKAAQEAERRLAQARNQLSQAKGQQQELQARLEQLGPTTAVEKQVDEAREESEAQRLALDTAERAVAAIQKERTAAQDGRRIVLAEIDALQREMRPVEGLMRDQHAEMARLEGQIELLSAALDRGRLPDGIASSGQFFRLVSVPAPYEIAVEAALGERLAAWTLPDEASLWRLLEDRDGAYWSAVVAGRTPASPNPPAPDHPAVIGWASDLLSPNGPGRELAAALLAGVLIVGDERAAYELAPGLSPGMMAVTPGGVVAHASGLIEVRGTGPQASILARGKERERLLAELAKLKTAYERAQAAIEDLRERDRQRRVALNGFEARAQSLLGREQAVSRELAVSQRRLDSALQRLEALTRQKEQAAAEAGRLEQRLANLSDEIAHLRGQTVALGADLAAATAQLADLPVAESKEQRRFIWGRIESTRTIVGGRQAVVDSRRVTLQQLEAQLRRLAQRRDALLAGQDASQLTESRARLAALENEIAALSDSLEPQRAARAAVEADVSSLEDQLAQAGRESHELESHYSQARIELSHLETQLDGLRERIQTDLGLVSLAYDVDQVAQEPLPMAEIVDELPQVEVLPEDIETTIQRFRGQLHRMGAINPDAPAEFEETRNRLEFLSQQLEDLTSTHAQLQDIIQQLDRETSAAFAATVEQVNVVFGDVFRRLFGGGSAQLVLTEPEDLTMTGVEIVARLPNRREQSLALLSGGERSLTAAALIFALLKVSPTPFCVLDEVDAMLDEANINRFRDLLVELSQQTQFIVITHNRGTVQAAETVYGISMGGDSASQVISVRPEAYLTAESA